MIMKMSVKEFAELTGVSVRTLHYYDEINLLKPAEIDENNGYRFYDRTALERMQEILFYRELDFPLKSICEILSSPDYDKQKALSEQKKLLILKKERLERIISAIDNAEESEAIMKALNNNDYEAARKQYESEAKERWGKTEAYKEHTEKTKDYSKDKWQSVTDGLDSIFGEFAECVKDGNAPDSEAAKALTEKLQKHITDNFYTCTNEILSGLGQMYVCDERFTQNIDKHGVGTAEFVNKAIIEYCK
ncbi:MAG: MerR family transcriptional regulator [Bacteroidales bacterium]|nr:MerR family transcriptional regulator [Bacteroidales bacterium]